MYVKRQAHKRQQHCRDSRQMGYISGSNQSCSSPSLPPPIQQKSPILAYCSTINFLFPSRCSNVTKLIHISSNTRLYFLFKRLFRPVTRWQRLYTHRCLIILYRQGITAITVTVFLLQPFKKSTKSNFPFFFP